MFDCGGGFDELHMNLDFACYILAGTTIGPCFWPANVMMTMDPPIGYIAMNDHSSPLVKDSKRIEYQVLIPIYGFTQQDDKMLYNINMVSRDFKHKLISVWTWPDFELNFNTKLVSWPMGFSWQPAFTTNMSFDGTTYSQGHLTDYTVGSYDSQLGYFNAIPSPSLNEPSPSPSILLQDMMQPSHLMSSFSADLSWPANYNHKPNNFALNLCKIIGHYLQPGEYMGFCNNQDELQTRTLRMLAALETQLVSNSADYDVIAEIISLQMAKEIWHHTILCPVASNPSTSISDIYWNQILDQQGNVSLEVVIFIVCLFYEWCQKALNVTLDRMAATDVILIYKHILHLKGPPLDKIQHVARDLGFIKYLA
ncbi:hypothetical protein BDR06DRAFT_972628 [Suillus hirtellus]|nr:hypothetical protein BDR06DRAFT_972628 [Suillus hirtellus]